MLQTKTKPQKKLHEGKISSLPDKEFKVIS